MDTGKIFDFTIGFTPIPNTAKKFGIASVVNDIQNSLIDQKFIPLSYSSKPGEIITKDSILSSSDFCSIIFFIKFNKEYKT